MGAAYRRVGIHSCRRRLHRRCGIATDRGLDPARVPYDLRHSFASLLIHERTLDRRDRRADGARADAYLGHLRHVRRDLRGAEPFQPRIRHLRRAVILDAVKRIGLLGGMSWESTVEYHRFVNEAVQDRLGGLHSTDYLLRSVDFAGVEELQRTGRWDEAGELLAGEARALVAAGAELIVMCTNTMHKVADTLSAAIDVPFVHIADTTADAVRGAGLSTVGLLATAYTMEHDFYVGRLRDRHGLEVLAPRREDRGIVHRVIYDELCVGVVNDHSRREYRRIMADLAEHGADAILLGCTEVDLLVGPDDAPVPVFDTTRLHAERAVEMALEPARTL
jgi:aspartate racemase